jgi:branched-chain amino acid transport system permease protein
VTILTILFFFPIITPNRYYITVLAEIFILALLAISYDILLGYTGIVSFGHAAFFGIGAYVFSILWISQMSFPLAILATIFSGVLLGLAMGSFLKRTGGMIFAMVTIAFAEIVRLLFERSRELTGGETGLYVPKPDFIKSSWFTYFGLIICALSIALLCAVVVRELVRKDSINRVKVSYCIFLVVFLVLLVSLVPEKLPQLLDGSYIIVSTTNVYFFALMSFVILFFIARRITSSPIGRIWIAIRENENRVEMLGYNAFRYKLISMIISAIFASLAGALYAILLSITTPTFLEASYTINALVYSIIGGIGTLIGPVIGAGIVTTFQRIVSSYLGGLSTLILGIIYIVIVLLLPYGIVGTWKMKSVSVKEMLWRLIISKMPGRRKKR